MKPLFLSLAAVMSLCLSSCSQERPEESLFVLRNAFAARSRWQMVSHASGVYPTAFTLVS